MKIHLKHSALILMAALMLMTSCTKEKASETRLEPMIAERKVELFTEKAEDLYKLNLVWGELKYFHPAVVSTGIDWDGVLMEKLSYVFEQEDPDMDTYLLDWVKDMGSFSMSEYDDELRPDTREYKSETDALYFLDDDTFRPDLRNMLSDLSETNIRDREKSYADVSSLVPDFSREKGAKSRNYPSLEDTLLSFFRIWNAVNYFYPYKEGMDSMEELFYRYLDDFVLADTEEKYALAVMSFTSELKDTHVRVELSAEDLFGTHRLPVEIEDYFDSYIVTSVWPGFEVRTELLPGDILVSINGKSIKEIVRERGGYVSVSSDERTAMRYAPVVLSVDRAEDNDVSIIRKGTAMDVSSSATTTAQAPYIEAPAESGVLEGNIGYIDAGAIRYPKDLDKIMETVRDTDGLIIDMRRYPGTIMTDKFPSYFLKKDTEFCKVTVPDPQRPGSWLVMDNEYLHQEVPFHYGEDVVLITNENTLSHGEFTVMLLSESKKVTTLGGTTNGTDGNVTILPIPGGRIMFTSLGIYEPDMDETERVGLVPDILVTLDPRALAEGRDLLLEKAMELLD